MHGNRINMMLNGKVDLVKIFWLWNS